LHRFVPVVFRTAVLAILLAVLPAAAQTPAAASGAAPPAKTNARPPAERLGQVVFEAGSGELSEIARAELDRVLTALPPEGDRRRIQLLGFATGDAQLVSTNRRLSLDRVLAVRQYLLEHGIKLERMDARALGTTEFGEGPADRVDVMLGIVDVPAPAARKRK
jgi:outer membrane protein OmpA-like peptidoglycan-associated protein